MTGFALIHLAGPVILSRAKHRHQEPPPRSKALQRESQLRMWQIETSLPLLQGVAGINSTRTQRLLVGTPELVWHPGRGNRQLVTELTDSLNDTRKVGIKVRVQADYRRIRIDEIGNAAR